MSDDNWGVTLNGLNLTGATGDTTFKALKIKNWPTGPGSTGGAFQKPFQDGWWVTEAYDQGKTLVVDGTIKGPHRSAIREGFSLLGQYIPRNGLAPLVVEEDGLVRHMMVRLDEAPPGGEYLSDRLATFDVQLVAPDGRKLSGDGTLDYTHSAQTGLPVTTGTGLELPAAVPWTIDAVQAQGSVTVTNAGSARPPVKILLTNVTNPVITSDGERMAFNITVGPGQTLEVDLDSKTVKLNGVNRRNALVGGWIQPENGTQFQFNASTYNSNALMTVRWSDAWR